MGCVLEVEGITSGGVKWVEDGIEVNGLEDGGNYYGEEEDEQLEEWLVWSSGAGMGVDVDKLCECTNEEGISMEGGM